jgi:rhodanese-related sulfurtransferase
MQDKFKIIQEEILAGTAQLFDVREQDEWEAGHLKLAHLITLSELREGEEPSDSFERSKKTYLHCRSGGRVLEAEPILTNNFDFESVIPLAEGYNTLIEEGFEGA